MNVLVFKLVAQRIALGLLLLLAVSALIFAGTELLPGDVAQSILGQSATPEAVANLRREMGLDQPALQRYFSWLGSALQGDLGVSLSNQRDIAEAIGDRLGNTLFLAFWTALIAVPLAILLGLLAVRYQNRWPDRLISGSTLTAISLPEFFVGYIMIYVFAVHLQWFPSLSTVHSGMSLGERLYAITLPVATLILIILAHMMRMTRAALLNVMQSPYIETAELKGLSGLKVIWRHAMPNAISPVVNVVMINLAFLVVGVVVIEVVFVYPGLGQFLIDHVARRDLPVVQACGLIFATVYILVNMLADVIAILANPRLRHPK